MHNEWFEMKPREITQRAGMLLKKRLTEYEQPEIDSHLEKELVQYVRKRKHSN
jgi:trimethylamine:corrinoid methyltransferase-like protein